MRVFIAIELPAAVKTSLAALQTEVRKARADVSWAKPENLHLTLKFLGEVDAQQIPAITNACVDAVLGVPPFSISIKDVGGFPNLKQPRVLWVGIADGLSELRTLHQKLDTNLQSLGFEKESRAFNPHLTLGRVKSLQNLTAATAKLLTYPLPDLLFQANELVVMQSQLHSAGAIYTPLAKCLLQ
ncbi:MAG: RNA 2',3'-cyclic phosphodiesterase [Acidobacteria bacterium]|nr:RNA 2',3'-cyclic phosphodiesterase [Acidobacteriota bacterium]